MDVAGLKTSTVVLAVPNKKLFSDQVLSSPFAGNVMLKPCHISTKQISCLLQKGSRFSDEAWCLKVGDFLSIARNEVGVCSFV